jgi:RNA polymerase-binding transcription factor
MTMTKTRYEDLKQTLQDRRHEMQRSVEDRIRHARTDAGNEVLDEADSSGADIQADLEFALIQMNSEALRRVDDALVRLEAGEYGCCCDCAGEISESRLRALPFAVRCRNCEQRREQGQDRERELEQKRSGASLFSQTSAGL